MFEMSFTFPDEQVKPYDLINAALSNLELSDLSISEQKGSLAVTTFPDPRRPKEYAYVLRAFALKCNRSSDTAAFHFQFDVAAFPWEACDDNYMETWKNAHPDRELCFLQTITYEAAKATVYIVLHHERAA